MTFRLSSRAAKTWITAITASFMISVVGLAASHVIRGIAVRGILAAAFALPPSDKRGRTNVLLLGIGGDGHTAPDLTDTIIITSVAPKTHSITMLSIPRDTAVFDTDGRGYGKINSLYAQYASAHRRRGVVSETGATFLAMEELADEIGRRTGIEIHGVMKMDFVGFETMIDASGGLDIDVPETIVDHTFPLREGVVGSFRMEKGLQHMDGKTALRYARSRHSTSDFDRSARQQLILSAFAEKAGSLKILGNAEFLAATRATLADHLETTFDNRELFGLGALASSVPTSRIVRMGLNYRTGGDSNDAFPGSFLRPDGGSGSTSMLPISPTDAPSDWSRIRDFALFLMDHPDLYVQQPVITLRAEGTSSLMTQRLRNELTRYGFTVEREKGRGERIQSSRIEYIGSDYQEAAAIIGNLLRLPVTEIARDKTEASLVVMLGTDYRFID